MQGGVSWGVWMGQMALSLLSPHPNTLKLTGRQLLRASLCFYCFLRERKKE